MVASPALSRSSADRFYVRMAAACAAIAFSSFTGTYWLQLPAGTFVGRPIVHLHAFLFSAWMLLFLVQALLIAHGNRRHHQAWGMLGIALATAMVFVGLGAAINSLNIALEAGHGDAARAFFIVSATGVALFAGLFMAAMANLRRSDWHKRLMLVATISLLQAAIARVFFLAITGGGPGLRPGLGPPLPVQITIGPGLVADLLILVAMAHDMRMNGRPHPAYLWGLAAVLTVQLIRVPLSGTTAWLAVAEFLRSFSV